MIHASIVDMEAWSRIALEPLSFILHAILQLCLIFFATAAIQTSPLNDVMNIESPRHVSSPKEMPSCNAGSRVQSLEPCQAGGTYRWTFPAIMVP
jgi:hypothetical protein